MNDASAYSIFNLLHSYNHYLLVAALLAVVAFSLSGWLGKRSFSSLDKLASTVLITSTHLQLVLGLVLYLALSPKTKAAFASMGAAMKDSNLRYFAVEHITAMIIAVVLIQIGRTKMKRAVTDKDKHKSLAIYSLLALVVILVSLVPKGLLW
jgi:uncharacterized membrane protein